MIRHIRIYLFAGLVTVLMLVGLASAYQFFESGSNETYCNSVSSKFCKSNPLEIDLLQNHENSDTNRMAEISKMMEKGDIDGFSFSSEGFSISSEDAMIKDMYFEDTNVPILTISLEFFKSGTITMTNPIQIIRSEFPDKSFATLQITINGNPVPYDEISHDRIAFKMEDFSEIIQIQALP